jgi:hypothetical protein
MEFQNDVQRQCWERIQPIAQGLFGVFARFMDERPSFAVKQGSAVCFTRVAPWQDTAVLTATAWVARDVTPDPELYERLVRLNSEFVFGAFYLDDDNDVAFEQTIFAPTADPDEIKHTVMAVVVTADSYDDEIVGRWGGKRGID